MSELVEFRKQIFVEIFRRSLNKLLSRLGNTGIWEFEVAFQQLDRIKEHSATVINPI